MVDSAETMVAMKAAAITEKRILILVCFGGVEKVVVFVRVAEELWIEIVL